jgi:hypothetical protein
LNLFCLKKKFPEQRLLNRISLDLGQICSPECHCYIFTPDTPLTPDAAEVEAQITEAFSGSIHQPYEI